MERSGFTETLKLLGFQEIVPHSRNILTLAKVMLGFVVTLPSLLGKKLF